MVPQVSGDRQPKKPFQVLSGDRLFETLKLLKREYMGNPAESRCEEIRKEGGQPQETEKADDVGDRGQYDRR